MIAAVFWLLLAPIVVLALPHNSTARTRQCGFYSDPATIIANEKHFKTALSKAAKVGDEISVAAIAPIPVVWHVIQKNGYLAGGNIPDSMIQATILATNQHYAGTGISFELYRITRTLNAAWFSSAGPGTQLERNMKALLHEGNSETLNVYSVGFETVAFPGDPNLTLLGYSSQPIDYQLRPLLDGVMILYSVLYGGFFTDFTEGKTLTHEIGHWLGLYHPFEGGCSGFGDYVSDTPPQADASDGCPTGKDTCLGGGLDSIHNFMDYTVDACRNSFTPGQVTRMEQSFLTYRQVAT